MSRWWNKTVDAGKQAIAELKEEVKKFNNAENKSPPSSPTTPSSADAAAGPAEMDDHNPVLPDMFHDFAPCPVVYEKPYPTSFHFI